MKKIVYVMKMIDGEKRLITKVMDDTYELNKGYKHNYIDKKEPEKEPIKI